MYRKINIYVNQMLHRQKCNYEEKITIWFSKKTYNRFSFHNTYDWRKKNPNIEVKTWEICCT